MDLDNGTPAWKARYSLDQLFERRNIIGSRSFLREFFHQHIEEGNVFQHDWIQYEKALPIRDYAQIIFYGDPSFKNTKASDFKAIVAVGKTKPNHGAKLHILFAWVRKASINAMVQTFYDAFDQYKDYAQYYIEANMLQDLLFADEFVIEGERRGYQIPIRLDRQKKPDKATRIENLSPLFERGYIKFAEHLRNDHDTQTLIDQLLAFPDGHDDGPDALEGATNKIQLQSKSSNFTPRLGKYTKKPR